MQERGERALESNTSFNADHGYSTTNGESKLRIVKTSEKAIWNNLKKGDEGALGELYNLHVEDLFSYGIRHSQDRNYVMDCIHDVFLDLYKYKKSIPALEDGKYYLFKCLKRKINKKYQHRIVVLSEENDYLLKDSLKNHIKSHEDTIIRAERKTEKNEKLSAVLDTLTQKQRRGIYLRFNQEKSYEEISEIMGVTVQTARTIVYRALKALRS
ncbi:RNA polymerase sigma factor [Maribacter thermophilus]|uniref:RNA polymerase sigma factor n=1 Tax=Maribacter thermophilus TaxID=1197874 RepID=UPI000640D83F|nr:sigma-70 family RNA polymerase sigma factor [Maribacter thermophilus]